jgi:hypothetical protein
MSQTRPYGVNPGSENPFAIHHQHELSGLYLPGHQPARQPCQAGTACGSVSDDLHVIELQGTAHAQFMDAT